VREVGGMKIKVTKILLEEGREIGRENESKRDGD
jgi:hypothetical protein